jgi:DNA-directed RNA polymerase specialized sigma24 family protein
MTIDQWAEPISDAARIVRATIPRHSLDLEDLVQIGWEATLRYLSPGSGTVSRVLVFVAAKAAMLTASAKWLHKAWKPNASGNRVRSGPEPEASEWQEWLRAEPTPPIEFMIDVRRALARAREQERDAWLSTRWEGFTLAEAGQAQRCKPFTVLERARRVDARLTRVARA